MRLAWLLVLTTTWACGGGPGRSAAPALPEATAKAGTAIDPRRCAEGKRERPFLVGWDVTDVAEISAASQEGLIAVRVDGCEVQVVPGCTVPVKYQDLDVPGGQQSLQISDQQHGTCQRA